MHALQAQLVRKVGHERDEEDVEAVDPAPVGAQQPVAAEEHRVEEGRGQHQKALVALRIVLTRLGHLRGMELMAVHDVRSQPIVGIASYS